MAWQGGRVQQEHSNIRPALYVAKFAEEGFSCPAIEDTQYLIKKPRAEVWDEEKQGVEFPGLQKVKAAIEIHLAMLRQSHTDSCLPGQHSTAKNPLTRWRRKDTGPPPPNRGRQRTSEATPPLPVTPSLPGIPPAPPIINAGSQRSQILNLPARYVYSHTSLLCAE